MRDKTELSSALYDAIHKIGKHKIQSDVISDIKFADKYMQVLFNRSIERFGYKLDDYSLVALYEILLHFMLTACTLPSQRKVMISQHLYLDLVIPNLQTLSRSPSDVIMIQFIRSPEDMTTFNEILSLFKLRAEEMNIWLISTMDRMACYTTYVIDLNDSSQKYLQIIQDIDTFLKERRDKSFRFISN
jgi:hypothetical protein